MHAPSQNLQEVGVVNLASLDLVWTLIVLSEYPVWGAQGMNRESGIGGRGFRDLSPVGSVTVTDLR